MMKLRVDYIYQHCGDTVIAGTGRTTTEDSLIDWTEAKSKIADELAYKFPGRVFEITPITFTRVDTDMPTWLILLLFFLILFVAGLVAAGICTVIMGLTR